MANPIRPTIGMIRPGKESAMSASFYVAASVVLWGLWGFTGKIATKYNIALVVSGIAFTIQPLGAALLFALRARMADAPPLDLSWPALLAILATTLCGMAGSVCYYLALSKGSASLVVSLTAVYPAITVLLAVLFLKEKFTLAQAAGLALILAGTWLVGGE